MLGKKSAMSIGSDSPVKGSIMELPASFTLLGFPFLSEPDNCVETVFTRFFCIEAHENAAADKAIINKSLGNFII